MKILLAPIEIANQLYLISKELRHNGYDAKSVNYYQNKFGFKCDINLNIGKNEKVSRVIKELFFFLKFPQYDIFHFNFGQSLLYSNLDLPILKLFNKKIVFYFHGSDIRNKDYFYFLYDQQIQKSSISAPPKSSISQQKRLRKIQMYADIILVSTPDLLELFNKDAIYFPPSVDISQWTNQPTRNVTNRNEIKILHAPTNKKYKGTKFVINAVEKLKRNGYKITLNLIENAKHDQMVKFYQDSDIRS